MRICKLTPQKFYFPPFPDSNFQIYFFQPQLAPDVSDALVDSYFTHFNQVFPVLSKPHFVDQLKQGSNAVDSLLLNAVYATGAQYCRVTKPDMPINADLFITRCRVLLEENSEEATMPRLQVNYEPIRGRPGGEKKIKANRNNFKRHWSFFAGFHSCSVSLGSA